MSLSEGCFGGVFWWLVAFLIWGVEVSKWGVLFCPGAAHFEGRCEGSELCGGAPIGGGRRGDSELCRGAPI